MQFKFKKTNKQTNYPINKYDEDDATVYCS